MTEENTPESCDDVPECFGVWVAYYSDFSDVVIFKNEIDCLRVAVKRKMEVKFVIDSESIRAGIVESEWSLPSSLPASPTKLSIPQG